MVDRNRSLEAYRFFGISPDESVVWDICVDCWDDDDARAKALGLSDQGLAIEVWNVSRFVACCDTAY